MKITRAEIAAWCLPGDVIAVEYLSLDTVAHGIRFAEQGKASHALCCLGGLDIVEATITGVSETNLHNYLRGNTILTIRCTKPAPTPEQAELATRFWDDRVLDPYDIGMIIGSVPILFARYVLGMFSKKLGSWAIRNMPNMLASDKISTCAELAIRGVRKFRPTICSGYPDGNITPETLRTHPSLHTKVVLHAAILQD